MIVVNLFGGPGAGKSTTAAGVFHKLKLKGYNCELVTEYAKDLTWEERHNALLDQMYVFAKQNRRLERLREKVDVVITDSPILLSKVYAADDYYECFVHLVEEVFESYFNLNFFITRVNEYNPVGRNQTEEEARSIDEFLIAEILSDHEFVSVIGDESAIDKIVLAVEDTMADPKDGHDGDDNVIFLK